MTIRATEEKGIWIESQGQELSVVWQKLKRLSSIQFAAM
jgi:hypothetical protein